MEPAKMMKLMTAIEKGDLDVSKLKSIGNIFQDKQSPLELNLEI
jgi:hypothetical protein